MKRLLLFFTALALTVSTLSRVASAESFKPTNIKMYAAGDGGKGGGDTGHSDGGPGGHDGGHGGGHDGGKK